MLIDAFLGFDELLLASFRIDYLSKYVDKTFIFESNITHSGLKKPLYFEDWYSKLDYNLQNKISVINIDLNQYNESWDREISSREFAMNFLRENFKFQKFILSDIDEIPSLDQVKNMLNTPGLFHFKTPTYYRKINWALRDSHSTWSRGVMGEVSGAIYPNGARFTKSLPMIPGDPGAHFSYLGFDSQKLEKKLLSFAHTELGDASKESLSIISLSDRFRIDHLGRFYSQGFGLLRVVQPDENNVVENAKKYFPHDFFDNVEISENLLLRLYKSAVLTTFYNNLGEFRLDSLPFYEILLTLIRGIAHGIRRLIIAYFRK